VDTYLRFISSLLLLVILKGVEQVLLLQWALADIQCVDLNERIEEDFRGRAGLAS